jgi:hypothetical protein
MSKQSHNPSIAGPQSRNVEIRIVKVAELIEAPWNDREHPDEQKAALDETVQEIGWYGYPDVFVRDDGKYVLCDGHLRKSYLLNKYGPAVEIQVNVTNLTEQEARMATATKDPISAMARHHAAKQEQLLASLTESQQEIVQKIIGKETATPATAGGVTFKEITPAPPMTFVLVGIPTMSFGKIAQQIEQLAAVPEIEIMENVSTGGT